MKVSEAIEVLSSMNPNGSIIFTFWDREFVNTSLNMDIDDDDWDFLSEEVENSMDWSEVDNLILSFIKDNM